MTGTSRTSGGAAESPFLTGAALDTFAHLHGRLLRSDEVVALVVRSLAAR